MVQMISLVPFTGAIPRSAARVRARQGARPAGGAGGAGPRSSRGRLLWASGADVPEVRCGVEREGMGHEWGATA